MALAVYFAPRALTADQYAEINRRLDAAGASTPAGRTSHCAFAAGPSLHIFETWNDLETFDAFGGVLIPILNELGVDVGRPLVTPVHELRFG